MPTCHSFMEDREHRLAALDVAIERGLDDVRSGRAKPAEEVFDRLEAKYMRVFQEREAGAGGNVRGS